MVLVMVMVLLLLMVVVVLVMVVVVDAGGCDGGGGGCDGNDDGCVDDDEKADRTYHTSAANEESNDDNEAEEIVQGRNKFDKNTQCGSCGKDGDEELIDVTEEMKDVFGNIQENSKGDIFGVIPEGTEACIVSDINNPDDKLAGLKMLIKLQESGISLKYRCPS